MATINEIVAGVSAEKGPFLYPGVIRRDVVKAFVSGQDSPPDFEGCARADRDYAARLWAALSKHAKESPDAEICVGGSFGFGVVLQDDAGHFLLRNGVRIDLELDRSRGPVEFWREADSMGE